MALCIAIRGWLPELKPDCEFSLLVMRWTSKTEKVLRFCCFVGIK
jgi:hypothetical protein